MVIHYSQRDLVGPAQAAAIRNLIQALLVGELIQPSKTLWLASAWVSDILSRGLNLDFSLIKI